MNRIQKHSLSLWSTIDEIDFYRMIEPLIACLRVGLCSQLLRVPEESFKLYSAMFSYYREFRRFRPNSVLFVDRLTPPPCQIVLDLQTPTLQRRLPFGEESKILSFPCGPAKHLENTSITRRHILLSFVYYVTLCVRLCKALVYSLWIIFLNSSPIGLSRSRWEWLS